MELTNKQTIKLLRMYGRLATPAMYEVEMGVSQSQVNAVIQDMGVNNTDEALKLAKRLEDEYESNLLQSHIEERKKARLAQEVARQRLSEMGTPEELIVEKENINDIRDKERAAAKRFDEANAKLETPSVIWTLPDQEGHGSYGKQIEKFGLDLMSRGMNHVCLRYNVNPVQVKYEARELGLKIDWDMIPR